MASVARGGRQVLRRALHEHGLTMPQFGVLRVVGEAGAEGVKLSDIGEHLLVTCGNVTGLVDRLEELGYVARSSYPGDRRVLLARLTSPGQAVYDRIVPAHSTAIVRIMSCLSDDELETLAGLMDRLGANLADLAAEDGGAVLPPERNIHSGAC